MISGIVLAAGLSKRMGVAKQDLLLAGRPMIGRAVDAFLDSTLDEVIVVLRPGLKWRPAQTSRLRVVANPDHEEGIASSLKLGLRSVDPACRAVLVGLGDKPAVLPSTIGKIISAYEGSSSKVVVPTHGGVRGNPVLIDGSLFVQLLGLKGDSGAKEVMRRNEAVVLELPVDDEGVLLDVDTPADLRRAEELLASRAGLERGGEAGNQ